MPIDPRHLISLQGKQHILYAGILDCAHHAGLVGIETDLVQIPTAENGNEAIVKATVRMDLTGDGPIRTYEAYGDASPRNVGPKIATALIRMAETRAKARALRDATNQGDPLADDPAGDPEEAPAPRSLANVGVRVPARAVEDTPEPVPAPRRMLPTAPSQGDGASTAACEIDGCGVILTPGQVKVSQANFDGRLLCPSHQRFIRSAQAVR